MPHRVSDTHVSLEQPGYMYEVADWQAYSRIHLFYPTPALSYAFYVHIRTLHTHCMSLLNSIYLADHMMGLFSPWVHVHIHTKFLETMVGMKQSDL